ncbi:hypothetical protein FIBSPDRAFT_1047924 [Athelia psychrophila]|uniref:NADP-dependent oxidoreductase domain-containing protein n=1 Tax=Athelia psychrophila TaxID=1759441 RepID=A0A166EEI0_9AGAM|nr:hypothetical protein FIBSPDRAFT_1047924 [Fibularhizoctonia sp. CBS 109695]
MTASSTSQALLCDGNSYYRSRRNDDPGRKSVRGCIVNTIIGIIKQGGADVPGLLDNIVLKRLVPMPATKIRRFFGWGKEDDVRKQACEAGHAHTAASPPPPPLAQETENRAPEGAEDGVRRAHRERAGEKTAKLATVKVSHKTVLGFRFRCGRICQSHAVLRCIIRPTPCPSGDKFIPLRPDDTRNVDIDWKMTQTWKDMEALVKKGKVKAEITSTVNRLELHLYNPQLNLLAHLKSEAIFAQAYSPLGPTNSPLLTNGTTTTIAKMQRLQTSDALLGHLRHRVLPKLVTPARIASNCIGTVAAVKRLTEEDLQTLDGVAVGGKRERLIVSDCGTDFGLQNWP